MKIARLGPVPPTLEPTVESEVPPEFAAFARGLRDELRAFEPPDPIGQALDTDRWPWTSVAAVLGGFRPLELRALDSAAPSSLSPLIALGHVVFTSVDGR